MGTTTTTTHTTEAYLSADQKGKASLRADIVRAISVAVTSGDMDEAQRLVAVQATYTTPKAGPAQIDWEARRADLAATLQAALVDVLAGRINLPEGVEHTFEAADHEALVQAGTVDASAVTRFATISGRKAKRGAVIDWIESVVDDQPAKISDLRRRWVATSDYPQAPPSAGAIGAAFDRVADGVDADFEVVTVDGKRGAVAIA